MYVCMYVCMDVSMDQCMYVYMYVYMYVCVCMYVCMHICMYVLCYLYGCFWFMWVCVYESSHAIRNSRAAYRMVSQDAPMCEKSRRVSQKLKLKKKPEKFEL